MNSSLKIGAVSGLIAGFVAGIVGTVAVAITSSMGLTYFFIPPPIAPMPSVAVNEIALTLIWGMILGAIYSRAYPAILGKRFAKGLVYGLFCHLILGIRITTFFMPYFPVDALGDAVFIDGFPKWIAYGLALVALYGFLQDRYYTPTEELKIVEYRLGSGVARGAVAGIIGGITAWATLTMGDFIKLWSPPAAELSWTIGFMISRLGTHMFLHMIYGAIFGAIFAKVYGLVPGKRIIKGIYYGLILILITGFQKGAYYAAYGQLTSGQLQATLFDLAKEWVVVDLFALTVYGLVLGALYKK